MKNKNKGFTLIELLISISIIAILTSLASVSFSAAQKKARDAKRVQDAKLVQVAAEQYYSLSGGVYPVAATAWSVNGQATLEAFPTEVKPGWEAYSFNVGTSSPGSEFCLCVRMENANAGNCVNNSCVGVGTTGDYFCTKNQQ